MFLRKHAKMVIESLKCDEWVLPNNYIQRKHDGIRIWTGNGVPFIDFYPERNAFNIFEKKAIHVAVCECVARGGKPENVYAST